MFPYKSLLFGGLIAIILIGGGYFVMYKKSQFVENSNLSNAEGLKREVVAKGKIAAELPQDIVLPGTQLILSTKTPTQDGFVVSASLATTESVETILNRYVAYFNARDYAVERKFDKDTGSIAATKQGRTIQVGIFKGENRVKTSIAIMEIIK